MDWRWAFWVPLILGGVTQAVHYLVVPETRSTVLLERAAEKLRREGRVKEADTIQIEKPVLNLQHALTIWSRPVSYSSVISLQNENNLVLYS